MNIYDACEQAYKNGWNAATAQMIEPPKPNTELSFGASDGQYDFVINYCRAKPLNRFQIWMYKMCFGIRAKNI